jgi:nucleotide-binding universal stress UspA family protein/nitrite reductase/ring-hydroxylating ferredoxin subunit
MSHERILVGTDGSPTAEIAEGRAIEVAQAVSGELLLVTAHAPEDVGVSEQILKRSLENTTSKGVVAKTITRPGDPASVILDVADDEGADLIVLGDRGMGKSRRVFLGGVPDRVSHYSPCDVLIVRTSPGSAVIEGYRRMLVATDGTVTSFSCASRGFELARALGARVSLIYVGEDEPGEYILRETAIQLAGDPGVVESIVVQGDPADRICEVAQDSGFDLIVVGNKGMAGARRFLLGSVPNKISHESKTDVLIAQTTPNSLDDVANGQGALVVINGRKIALYRDEDGRSYSFSPRCQHMGCSVEWNASHKTWDCPCHGSRYNFDGSLINGPAVRGLREVKLN